MNKKVELEVKDYGIQCAVALGLERNQVHYKKVIDHAMQAMIHTLHVKILGETIETHEYPTNWWDSFKKRWFPNWLLRKYPYNITRIDVVALYPKLSLQKEKSKITLDYSEHKSDLGF